MATVTKTSFKSVACSCELCVGEEGPCLLLPLRGPAGCRASPLSNPAGKWWLPRTPTRPPNGCLGHAPLEFSGESLWCQNNSRFAQWFMMKKKIGKLTVWKTLGGDWE